MYFGQHGLRLISSLESSFYELGKFAKDSGGQTYLLGGSR